MPPSISDPAAPPEPAPNRRFLWPAEYYASATPKAVLPQWASYGCGAAALAVLLLVFIGGAWLSAGGFTQVLDLAFGMTLGEMRGMFTPEVTAAQKQALESEIETMRANVRDDRLPVKNLQGVLQKMQKSMADEKLTPAEVDELTAAAKKANGSRRVSKSQSLKESRSGSLRL